MNEKSEKKGKNIEQLKKIADIIRQNNNIVLIPHKNPDGDCMGSVSALATALNGMGKNIKIALVSEVPERLGFLWNNLFLADNESVFDVCITVDVAATYMIDDLKEKIFDKAKITCCIDHHKTNNGFAEYNYVDADASATGEIIYTLLYDILKCKHNLFSDECIYSAIVSDTGSFQYSNTTSQTHIIASNLVSQGINSPRIMRNLFEKKKISTLKFMNEIIQNMEFYFDNKVCMVAIDQQMLDKYNMTFNMVDEYSSLPRSIDGVEVGVILKVHSQNETKVSLRSNEYVDVASLAGSMGGGGHIRAAGVTLNDNLENAKQKLIQSLGEVINK